MQTFLHIVASDLFHQMNGHFEQVTVLFPNKRASLFFNQHLYQLADTPLWAPEYITISDLFQSLSPLTVADPLQLVCMLYKAYQDTGDGTDTETLDQFWSWGELMLSDFDDIDNNMVDAQKLFTNISDIDDLTHTDYLTEEQMTAIRRFFPNFHEKTELKEQFLNVWKRLLPTYERFRAMLLEEGIAYEGMLKRKVIEEISTFNPQRTYVIVGFNVLNETERRMFRYLKENAKTLFYWDFDTMYMKAEAGRFIEDNIRQFGNALPDANLYDNFSKPKEIHFVASPTENAQTRHVGTLLEKQKAPNDTAVVLCDESLLQPMLHAIPSGTDVNITMGFPMAGTSVSSLLMAMMELQLRGKAGSKDTWRYTAVAPLLKHPYVYLIAKEACLHTLNTLKQRHILFPARSLFTDNEFLQLLFTPQQNTGELLTWLITIIEQIGRKVEEAPLGTESVFNAYTMLCRLQRIYEQGLLNIQPITLQRLLLQLIKAKTIPFHGEPAVGLQVMGILETRNLDFRNVFLLSCNEGILPKQTRSTSFIPYNLREAYGMTTIERRTSLFAYYFYRLLQRAENVWIYYNNSTEGTSRGEMSRFMMQLLIHGTTNGIQQHQLTAGYTPQTDRTFTVEKTPAVMEKLHNRFCTESRILSPSAINTYINCPLQFYLQYIAKLKTEDDMTEDVGDNHFGSIFHYCMENIYGQHIGLGREIQANELYSMSADTKEIGRLVDEAFNVVFFKKPESEKHQPPRYNGEQLLNREVLVSYVRDQLAYDATLCPMTIIAVEKDIEPITLHIGEHDIRIGGIIDRIDRITIDGRRQLRIVDYKTSNKAKTAKTIDELFDRSKDKRSTHILQAFYYADIYTRLYPDEPLAPAVMYVKLAHNKQTQKDLTPTVILDQPVTDFAAQCGNDFHQQLTATITDIFNPSVPFTQDNTQHACKFCDFTQLCKRQKKQD